MADAFRHFEEAERLMRAGDFGAVDNMLISTDPDDLDTAPLLALLTITFHGKHKLTRRAPFLAWSERVLVQRLGAERAGHLLERRR